jgi:molybdate-binding protein/DNA-binding XRE family transcriptional regulator
MNGDTEAKNRGAKSKIALLRQQRSIAQADLATRVGVSRQFLSLVEAGRAQPNVLVALRLASELECSVEDLFSAPAKRETQAFSVQVAQPNLGDGARVDVANVGGRWVAHASDTPDSLGSGFARSDAVLKWVGGRAEVRPHRAFAELEQNIAVAGCDPALALLRGSQPATRAGAAPLPGRCLWINCGSSRALQLLAEGWVHLAGLHYTGEADENQRQVRRFDPAGNWQVLRFTRWENGWMIRPEMRAKFTGTADLAGKSVRLINRERGAGNRHWLDSELARHKIRPTDVAGYADEMSSHWECARALRAGRADVAVGPQAIAAAFGLGFIATGLVAFDLVVPKTHLDHPNLQAILERIRGRDFQREVETLPGYQATEAGTRFD